MDPAAEGILCNDAQVTPAAELVPDDIRPQDRGDVGRAVSISYSVSLAPVGDAWNNSTSIAAVIGCTVVCDLRIGGPMELDEGDFARRRANCLDSGAGIDSVGISDCQIRVHRCRTACKGGDSGAERWVTGNDVDKTTTIAVSDGPNAPSVDAKGTSKVVDEVVEEATVVDIWISGVVRRSVSRIRFETLLVALHVDHDAVWIYRCSRHACLGLDIGVGGSIARKSEDQGRSAVYVVVLRDMNCITPSETIPCREGERSCSRSARHQVIRQCFAAAG